MLQKKQTKQNNVANCKTYAGKIWFFFGGVYYRSPESNDNEI